MDTPLPHGASVSHRGVAHSPWAWDQRPPFKSGSTEGRWRVSWTRPDLPRQPTQVTVPGWRWGRGLPARWTCRTSPRGVLQGPSGTQTQCLSWFPLLSPALRWNEGTWVKLVSSKNFHFSGHSMSRLPPRCSGQVQQGWRGYRRSQAWVGGRRHEDPLTHVRKGQRGCRTRTTSEGLDLAVALQVEKVPTLEPH